MPRETLETKAHRLLAEGRLLITEVVPGGKVIATCRGLDSGEIHTLGWDPRGKGRWGCTCEASSKFHRRCSHIRALQLVVTRERAK